MLLDTVIPNTGNFLNNGSVALQDKDDPISSNKHNTRGQTNVTAGFSKASSAPLTPLPPFYIGSIAARDHNSI